MNIYNVTRALCIGLFAIQTNGSPGVDVWVPKITILERIKLDILERQRSNNHKYDNLPLDSHQKLELQPCGPLTGSIFYWTVKAGAFIGTIFCGKSAVKSGGEEMAKQFGEDVGKAFEVGGGVAVAQLGWIMTNGMNWYVKSFATGVLLCIDQYANQEVRDLAARTPMAINNSTDFRVGVTIGTGGFAAGVELAATAARMAGNALPFLP